MTRSWTERFEEPLNRYYRFPFARALVRSVLAHTRMTPNQVSLATVPLAGAAGWFVAAADVRRLALAAALFEARSVLSCAGAMLARARGDDGTNRARSTRAGMEAAVDWIGLTLLYVGIFIHFHARAPESGSWSRYLSVDGIILLALGQAALRSFAADYYRLKYTSIFERGSDDRVEELRSKILALGPESSLFDQADVLIGRLGHLLFEHEWFDPNRSASAVDLRQLQREQSSAVTRAVAFLWAISNGEFFLSVLVVSMLVNRLWAAQLFFATAGIVWVVAVVLLNDRYIKTAIRRAKLVVA